MQIRIAETLFEKVASCSPALFEYYQLDADQKGGFGGRHGIRTHDPRIANAVLSQLS
jgi:hypothetical protein